MADLAQAPNPRLDALRRLRNDLLVYSPENLKIKDKDGKIVPLRYNRGQLYLHERAEAQLARTGRVRMIVGKGRQTGGSTYIGSRFYQKTTMNRGVETYILTHEGDATKHLFDMVDRFHEHSQLRPHTAYDNAKELTFDRLDSGYAVGTAGSKAVGRSRTIRLLHGSEVAFWMNAQDHFAGVVQTVPDSAGTEIWLESTGNGTGGEYYSRVQQAIRGEGDYEFAFVPTHWSPEYARPIPDGWTATDDERKYQAQFNTSWEHIVWRRAKLAELRDVELYRQEYPMTVEDMFQNPGHDSFIKAGDVQRARAADLEGYGPLVIGADPSRFGTDRFSLAWRRGRKVSKVESRHKVGTMEAIGWLKSVIDNDKPAKLFIDAGGGGDRLYDIITSWGPPYAKIMVLVNFGSPALTAYETLSDGTRKAGPKNRRAEMWSYSRDWLTQVGGADIPDLDSLQADACAPGFHFDPVTQQLILQAKEELEISPDEWDAIALTFAAPVHETIEQAEAPEPALHLGGRTDAWMAS